MDQVAFDAVVQRIRAYRDKFVAHLDSERVAHVPILDGPAHNALIFYHRHIVTSEASPGSLTNLPETPEKLARGYEQSLNEAGSVLNRLLL
jgi:hypothetical protein